MSNSQTSTTKAFVILFWIVGSIAAIFLIAEMRIMPEQFRKRRPNVEFEYALATLGRRGTSIAHRKRAFELVQSSGVQEMPGVWHNIIANTTADSLERSRYLCEFFSRHVHEGMLITDIQDMDAIKSACVDDILWTDIGFASKLPSQFDDPKCDLILSFQTNFMAEHEWVIYLGFHRGRLYGEPFIFQPNQ